MASSSRDDPLAYPNPASFSSSPISASGNGDGYLMDPATPQIGSAAGSFQNDGFLVGESGSGSCDLDFGFLRPDFRQIPLAGTVDLYSRHVFLCYKNPKVWPAQIEAAEFDRLPRLLSAALMSRRAEMKKQTRLTICEGHDGTETSNGDVLIFPDMIRYRRLTHFDVDTFVEEVLVKDGEWLPGTPEKLKGSFVFVCSHGSRDRRCGTCGPPIIARFKEEIEAHGLHGKVSVSPCSHVGGHKYAGNVIIFSSNIDGEVCGHWYGYVTPDDVTILLEQHIGQGRIIVGLWRGQMGLSEEEQNKTQELRVQQLNKIASCGETMTEFPQIQTDITELEVEEVCCCQANGTTSSCCHTPVSPTAGSFNGNGREKTLGVKKAGKHTFMRSNSGKVPCTRKACSMPTWFECWEREDTYAALAVVGAAVSVGIAYSCYKHFQ